MILLDLDEREAEIVISALLDKISDMKTSEIILKRKVEELTEKLSYSENPNNSESEVVNNG